MDDILGSAILNLSQKAETKKASRNPLGKAMDFATSSSSASEEATGEEEEGETP